MPGPEHDIASGQPIGATTPPDATGVARIAELISGGGSPASSPIEEIAALVDGDTTLAQPDSDQTADENSDLPREAAEPRAMGFDVEDINRHHALVLMGSKAVVVKEQPNGPIQDRLRLLSLQAFYDWYANRFTEIVGHDGKLKVVTWGRRWVSHRDRRQFDGIEFFPAPDKAAGTKGYLNLWRGFGVSPTTEGKYTVFRDHLLTNVCGGDAALFNYLFAWFAHLIQRPRDRIGTAIVLRGRMGTGKTKVGEVIGSLIPAHYFEVDDPRYVTGQFNAHLASCLLLQVEEAIWAGDKTAEGRLKGMITSEFQMIEQKGIDPIRIHNYMRILMTSNETWVVPAGKDERRFCVLDVHDRCAQNHDYFREMDAELENGGRGRLLHDLLNFDLSKINLRQIPMTAALFEQKIQSLDPMDGWWFARLMEGTPARGRDDWPAVVPREVLYADYVRAADEMGARRKRDRATFGVKLRRLAPGVGESRPHVEIEPGVTKRVYSHTLPPLSDCRAAFEAQIGQPIDWPTAVMPEAAPVEANSAAEEIPI